MILFYVQLLSEDEVKAVFTEEFAKELMEESGWWFKNGNILVIDQKNNVQNAKVIVHEVIEYVVEKYLGFDHSFAHSIASEIEKEFEKRVGGGNVLVSGNVKERV